MNSNSKQRAEGFRVSSGGGSSTARHVEDASSPAAEQFMLTHHVVERSAPSALDNSVEVNDTFEGLHNDPLVQRGKAVRHAIAAVAQIVREAREAKGMTQQLLADLAGTTQPEIARIESGEGERGPTVGTLRKVAMACGMRMIVGFVPEEAIKNDALGLDALTSSMTAARSSPSDFLDSGVAEGWSRLGSAISHSTALSSAIAGVFSPFTLMPSGGTVSSSDIAATVTSISPILKVF